MFNTWMKNIGQNSDLVDSNFGPSLAIVVSGSEIDQRFWEHRFLLTCRDVFRHDGKVNIISTIEKTRKGSFLGVFNAWKDSLQQIENANSEIPDLTLMSLVIGKGSRLSPFTQAEGNRKSAFWTPMKTSLADTYISTADISNLSVNIWVKQLRDGGFRGLIVKWGDELIIPGIMWDRLDYHNIDAFRCVGKIEITESLALEKEWVVVDKNTGLMHFQFTRQDLSSLKNRLSSLAEESYELRINLGSLVLSYEFLEAAMEVFGGDILNSNRWADWDPYVWVALCCENENQWRAEAEYEQRIGRHGIDDLEKSYPDFFQKILSWRTALQARTGRPLTIGTLEFGDSFWLDLGLHLPLRESMDYVHEDSERGKTVRALFEIPEERDKNGNIVLRSVIPSSADIRDSVIIDSVIQDANSTIRQSQIIKSKHKKVVMPYGGSSLFCATDRLEFAGHHAVAYKSFGEEIVLSNGGRHSTLLTPDGFINIISNESLIDYSGDNYTLPIMGNQISFEEAGRIMAQGEGREIEAQWTNLWEKYI